MQTLVLLAVAARAAIGLASPAAARAEPRCRDIAIIVHKENPTQALSLGELVEIYTGQQPRWPDGRGTVVVAAPQDSDIERAFKRRVLRGAHGGSTVYGSPVPFRPVIMRVETAVQYVRRFPSTIAYVWSDMVSPDVKVLPVQGLSKATEVDCAVVSTRERQ